MEFLPWRRRTSVKQTGNGPAVGNEWAVYFGRVKMVLSEERERERERERESRTERQTDRQTDIQTDRLINRQTAKKMRDEGKKKTFLIRIVRTHNSSVTTAKN